MKLLHTSDWHLGRTLHGVSLLPAHADFLAWLLEVAIESRVSAVLVSGDIYDRAVPPVEAVRLLDHTLVAFSRAGIALMLCSGNHDSAIRLGFGSPLSARAGIHVRTQVAQIDEPLVLQDEHGDVGIYAIPYLLPDAVMTELGTERSHEAVLSAATALIRADAAARSITRTVVLSHAFITNAQVSNSERDIRVGGIGDAPASVFDGLSYVALGHLHRPQNISLAGSSTRLRYSGSPLAFSFSEAGHTKSVTLVELDAAGVSSLTEIATPEPRPLREVRGRLADLLEQAQDGTLDLAQAYVKAVLTDPSRPIAPMERLREVWPHTLVLDFAPDGEQISSAVDLARLSQTTDPVEVCAMFVEFVDREPVSSTEAAVFRTAIEAVQLSQSGA